MAGLDYAFIILYLTAVLGLGFWYQKRASRNLESYFLGGNRLPWLALAMSGSVSNFDITGTMWIVSMLFILGMKSMWIHWMWGFLMGAFFLAYMGKWVRRSKVMTGAEWMTTRFGDDRGGRLARTAYALMAVLTQASFIGYDFQGIKKFVSVYLPWPATLCALLVIGVTTLYVVLGGLYSVVVTDVVQTVLLTVAGLVIAVLSFQLVSPDTLGQILPDKWFSLLPPWRLDNAAGSASVVPYELFGALVMVWVLKGILLNAGGPAQMYDFQRFLAARSPKEAAKTGAAWSLFLIVRWAMCMGLVLLALSGIAEIRDPEMAMPVVLQKFLPVGVRGLVIAGLLSAFMSTFSSTVNSGASYIVRDFWQVYLRPRAGQKELVRAGYGATVGIVLLGILMGLQARSIHQIWNWMMMALGAGVVVPNVLRWYWWRLNGWGYAAGILAGLLGSILAVFWPEAPMYVTFPPIVAASLAASILVSLWTPAVNDRVLASFFRTVRPFGMWKRVRQACSADLSPLPLSERPSRAILNTGLGMGAVAGLYLAPMYLVAHRFSQALLWLAVALGAIAALWRTWYKPLQREN
jgi:SSS family solute:Na+ symporter